MCGINSAGGIAYGGSESGIISSNGSIETTSASSWREK